MRDPHIREALRKTELSHYINDSHSLVIEELKIPVAGARIDIAVVNGQLHGYEIKSACDTLQRLPNQLAAYELVFDQLTIITENKYHERILRIVPDWVGVKVCHEKDGLIEVQGVQANKPNLKKSRFHIAKLLWNDELKQILTEHNITYKKNLRNWLLCETLANELSTDLLSMAVREKLKARKEWKFKECYSSGIYDDSE